MNENEINNASSENNPLSAEEGNDQMTDMNQRPSLSDFQDDMEPQEGFTFSWLNLLIGVAVCLALGGSLFTDDWTFYIYLSVVVIIHELGHVIFGKSFGCFIKEMQVFFLPFVSYRPRQESKGNSWRNIKWSLGVVPLGGVTVFKSRASAGDGGADGLATDVSEVEQQSSTSPYIEDKPAWQRMLISAAGVLFNLVTFLVLYFALPYMSVACNQILRPLAVLSLLLAVLNILPIYPLDGGSVVFALYEMVTGKKPSQRFTTACSWIGFIFIILFFWVFPEWLDGILNSVFSLFF